MCELECVCFQEQLVWKLHLLCGTFLECINTMNINTNCVCMCVMYCFSEFYCVGVCVFLMNLFSLSGTTLCTISCDIHAHVTFIVASGNGTWWKRRVGVCNLPCQQEVHVEFKPPHTTIPCSLHTVMSVWLCISMKMPTMICVVCVCLSWYICV